MLIHLNSYTTTLFRSMKANYFIGQLWQLLTTSNIGARTQAWQTKWAVFQNPGVCLQAFSFLSSPPPPSSFSCAIFRVVFDSRSLFFAPKPHGNACYAGYDHSYPRPTVCVTYGFHNMSKYRGHMGRSLNFALYVLHIFSCYETRMRNKQWAWVTCDLTSWICIL